jgi:formylglycine-generating enzyme required for sulfatase activity
MRFVFGVAFAIVVACLLAQTPATAQTAASKNAIGMEFVKIPAGDFMMGCSPDDSNCKNDEKPQHQVRITKPFEMGRYEVTQAQWKAVMNANESAIVGDNNPVENVTRAEAIEFANRLNMRNDGYRYRLPTEAEWEYAARGQDGRRYPWGNDWVAGNANGKDSGKNQPVPAGVFTAGASPFGVQDMSGNVSEWTADNLSLYPESRAKLKPRNAADKVIKGGSFADSAENLTSSHRTGMDPNSSSDKVGFRCVATK